MRVGIFQPAAVPSTPGQRLDRLDAALATEVGLDLVVCPELFLSGFSDPELIAQRAEPRDGPSSRAAALIAADIEPSDLPAIRRRLPFLRDYKSFRESHD